MGVEDLIGPAASLVGGAASSAMGMYEAQQNRNFQADMSNTAHQREVTDLRKAGLNPILSAKLGGNSTPPGAMPSLPDLSSVGQSINSAKANSIQQQLADANVRKINADASVSEQTAKNLAVTSPFTNQMPQTDLGIRQNELFKSDAMTSPTVLRNMMSQVAAAASSAASTAELQKLSIPGAKNQSDMAKTWFGKFIQPYIQSALHASQIVPNLSP